MTSTTREDNVVFMAIGLLILLIALATTAWSGDYSQSAALQQLADAYGVPIAAK